MLNNNLIHEVELLSIKERVALMEYLAHSLQKELEKPRRKTRKTSKIEMPAKIEFSRGMLRRAGVPPLTDDEVEQALADSLIEDYFKTS